MPTACWWPCWLRHNKAIASVYIPGVKIRARRHGFAPNSTEKRKKIFQTYVSRGSSWSRCAWGRRNLTLSQTFRQHITSRAKADSTELHTGHTGHSSRVCDVRNKRQSWLCQSLFTCQRQSALLLGRASAIFYSPHSPQFSTEVNKKPATFDIRGAEGQKS